MSKPQDSPAELSPIDIKINGQITTKNRYEFQITDSISGREIGNITAIEFPVITAENYMMPLEVKLTIAVDSLTLDAMYYPDKILLRPINKANLAQGIYQHFRRMGNWLLQHGFYPRWLPGRRNKL